MTLSREGASGSSFDCTETVRRLWDYLDHELTPSEVVAVDAHLAECERCPPHFTFERAFLSALRTARAEHGASPVLRDRVSAILASSSSHD